ncbi:MAG: PVC-type heme-binding CxxCH protein, partial [Bacteroidota bacterium]
MKRNVLAFFRLLSVFVMVLSCISKKEPLPPLTYSGDSPRIQDPLSAEDSKRHIQVPEGFEVTLYAAEPNIINPIAFTWDENGRLWVVQSQDYPHGLENEVGGDRITICEDTDKDGKADKFIDFATEQSLTTGIVKVKGGIIVGQAPNMVFLQDTDGDDKMDKSTVLFDGFGTWDTHAGPSSLRYGLDNHIWGAVGYSGFENTFADKEISFKMGVYRFSRNGSYFEPVGQFNNNTWGLGFNEHFEIFGSTANNNHCCYVG